PGWVLIRAGPDPADGSGRMRTNATSCVVRRSIRAVGNSCRSGIRQAGGAALLTKRTELFRSRHDLCRLGGVDGQASGTPRRDALESVHESHDWRFGRLHRPGRNRTPLPEPERKSHSCLAFAARLGGGVRRVGRRSGRAAANLVSLAAFSRSPDLKLLPSSEKQHPQSRAESLAGIVLRPTARQRSPGPCAKARVRQGNGSGAFSTTIPLPTATALV